LLSLALWQRGLGGNCLPLNVSGVTENAGLENPAPSKMQGWKTQDWKTWDHLTGVENARPVAMERQSYK